MILSFLDIVARLTLGSLFSLSSIAKFLDPTSSRRSVSEFGLPAWSVPPLGAGLPPIEMAVAVTVTCLHSARFGAVSALILLTLFSCVTAISVALGYKPVCLCFGYALSKPAGWNTIIRNTAFSIIAIYLIARPVAGKGLLYFLTLDKVNDVSLFTGGIALWTSGLIFASIFSNLRGTGGQRLKFDNYDTRPVSSQCTSQKDYRHKEIKAKAFEFELPDINDRRRSLSYYLQKGLPVLLIFSDFQCGRCSMISPYIATWQTIFAKRLTIVVVIRGSRESNRVTADNYRLTDVLFVATEKEVSTIAMHYLLPSTPSAVLVLPDGTVGSEPIDGPVCIQHFISQWGE